MELAFRKLGTVLPCSRLQLSVGNFHSRQGSLARFCTAAHAVRRQDGVVEEPTAAAPVLIDAESSEEEAQEGMNTTVRPLEESGSGVEEPLPRKRRIEAAGDIACQSSPRRGSQQARQDCPSTSTEVKLRLLVFDITKIEILLGTM